MDFLVSLWTGNWWGTGILGHCIVWQFMEFSANTGSFGGKGWVGLGATYMIPRVWHEKWDARLEVDSVYCMEWKRVLMV